MNREIHVRSQRKNEHVQHALNQKPAGAVSDFDKIHFVHQSLPAFNLDDVDLRSSIGNINLPIPLYINAMTGGSAWTKSINEKLGEVAAAAGIPMAVGSMHAAIKHRELEDSYKIVRKVNPRGIVFANVGADVPLEGAKKAVGMIDADMLQIHLNAPQELIMPEGDRNFKSWRSNIEGILKAVDVPVIVKEVGFGMSRETIRSLKEMGVSHIDISGRGGTNFATIENARRKEKDMHYLGDWGISTVQSLMESREFQQEVDILASGGVRTPLDAVKSLTLGARAVGMSKAMLEHVENNGVEASIEYLKQFVDQMKRIAIMINAENIEEIKKASLVFSPELLSWREQRSLPLGEE